MRAEHTTAHPRLLDSPLDYTVAAVVLLAGIITAGTWAAGQLAGLLFRGAWPPVSLGQGLSAAAGLPHHWADPRQAWPATARPDLPGAPGYAVAGVLVLLLSAAGAWALIRWLVSRSPRRGFASAAQIRAALAARTVIARGASIRPSLEGEKIRLADVGVDLGRSAPGGVPLAASARDSVLVLAAPQQGKTSQVIIPWLRSWPGPALVTSVRLDVLENTAQMRRRRGPVAVMAPTGMIGWPDTLAWSPASGCERFDKARNRADVMVAVGKHGNAGDSQNAAFFGMTATNLLAGWLHAAAISGQGMDDVLRWALDERNDQPVTICRDHPAAAPGVAGMLDSIYRSPAETRSSIWTTVQTGVAPLLSPAARAVFVPPAGGGIDLEDFLLRRGTIYLLVGEKQAADLAPLISAFADELAETAKRIADRGVRQRLDPPLGLILDEVANVVPLPGLPALMSYAGGSGIFVTAVLQNMAQARNRWGREGADMIWGAATVKVILGGLGGDELRSISDLAGEYREALTTWQRGRHGDSLQTTLQDRKTLTPGQIRTLSEPRREALIIHATTPAVRSRMTRHYESRHRGEYAAAVAWARRTAGLADGPGPDAASGAAAPEEQGL
jgi:type IV secretory pathway TraG/TraD family ATPase VirD4